MSFTRADWEFLALACDHAESNYWEALQRYARTDEDQEGYRSLAHQASRLHKLIQEQLKKQKKAKRVKTG